MARRPAAKPAAKAPPRLSRAVLAANNVASPVSASRKTIAVHGNRSQLLGSAISTQFQAAGDNKQIPLVGNPTPQNVVQHNQKFRALSRYLRNNAPWIRALIDRLADKVIDTGPKPLSSSKALNDLFARSSRHFDSRGLFDFPQWLRDDVWKTFGIDGEVFVRVLTPSVTGVDARGNLMFDDDGLVPLKLRSMVAEFVPEWWTVLGSSFNGVPTVCINGIETRADNMDRRVAVWSYDQHPYDLNAQAVNARFAQQVPIEQVCHMFIPGLPGSPRGENRMTSILIRALRLNDYEDSEMRRKQLNNALCFFITESADVSGEGILPGEVDAETGSPVGDGSSGFDTESLRTQVDISPAGITKLPAGMSVTVHDPKATPQTDDWFSNFQILAFASCFGMPSYMVTQDFKDLSDRVMKFAEENLKLSINRERGYINSMILPKIWKSFVNAAYFSGRWQPEPGTDISDYYDVDWKWPIVKTSLLAQDIGPWLDAVKQKAISRDYMTEELFGLDPETTADQVALEAARDFFHGFNTAPAAILPPGSTPMLDWDPEGPYAQALLDGISSLEGVAPPSAFKPPPPPKPPAPVAKEPLPAE